MDVQTTARTAIRPLIEQVPDTLLSIVVVVGNKPATCKSVQISDTVMSTSRNTGSSQTIPVPSSFEVLPALSFSPVSPAASVPAGWAPWVPSPASCSACTNLSGISDIAKSETAEQEYVKNVKTSPSVPLLPLVFTCLYMPIWGVWGPCGARIMSISWVLTASQRKLFDPLLQFAAVHDWLFRKIKLGSAFAQSARLASLSMQIMRGNLQQHVRQECVKPILSFLRLCEYRPVKNAQMEKLDMSSLITWTHSPHSVEALSTVFFRHAFTGRVQTRSR